MYSIVCTVFSPSPYMDYALFLFRVGRSVLVLGWYEKLMVAEQLLGYFQQSMMKMLGDMHRQTRVLFPPYLHVAHPSAACLHHHFFQEGGIQCAMSLQLNSPNTNPSLKWPEVLHISHIIQYHWMSQCDQISVSLLCEQSPLITESTQPYLLSFFIKKQSF